MLISSFKNFKKHSANPRLSVRSLARECASGEQEGWKSVCNSHAAWQLQEVRPLFWEFTGWAYLSHRLQHGNHSKISYRLANLVGCQDKDWIHMWVGGMEYDLHASQSIVTLDPTFVCEDRLTPGQCLFVCALCSQPYQIPWDPLSTFNTTASLGPACGKASYIAPEAWSFLRNLDRKSLAPLGSRSLVNVFQKCF